MLLLKETVILTELVVWAKEGTAAMLIWLLDKRVKGTTVEFIVTELVWIKLYPLIMIELPPDKGPLEGVKDIRPLVVIIFGEGGIGGHGGHGGIIIFGWFEHWLFNLWEHLKQ